MIMKKISALLLSALSLLGITSCAGSSSVQKSAQPLDEAKAVTLTVFDVGKADAMILETKSTVTVIDTGCKGDGKIIEKYLGDKGIEKIDTLIITHFDKDHVGGAARVVKKFPIGTVYVPDYKSDSDEYLSFIQNASNAGTAITQVPAAEQREWNYDDAAFTLYAPQKTDYGEKEKNDFSLCLTMQYGTVKYLFTGDAEDARQQEIMALNLGTFDFLKFPYHGHYLSTTEDFLTACKPKATVICCSKKENADDKTVETLKTRGIEAYYTTGGNVTIRTDGSTMVCSQG
ncbi:MAG: MBL fold metallo-hydrolase [Oscillospiraceae bacterium]|nr:MBL fold metallo-hydrolase [Oscillospiraceae bacterium]